MFFSGSLSASDKAQRYCRIKYILAIVETGYIVVLLFLFTGLGFSTSLVKYLSGLVQNSFLLLAVYIIVVYLAYYLLGFPLNLYQSFLLEHKFGLSNQKMKDWLKDQAKSSLLFYLIALILAGVFYYTLKHFLHSWWLVFSLFWIFLSLILAKLAPVLIIPLFFKYKKLTDDNLRSRIVKLAEKMEVGILDVLEIDLSKNTLKGNAAFAGWGRTKRVILADTLKGKYDYDEIEVILAHEFAHYRLRHLPKLILFNSLLTVFFFYIIFVTGDRALGLFGLYSFWDVAALPVVLIYLVLLGLITQPLQNYLSRRLERTADKEALRVTGLREAFIRTFEKLAAQNLADRNPPALIKFLFFNHPPIDERIDLARKCHI
ncbi:MAG: M48 family metallopeptidase [Candidatus Omnitrophica bacterium]|nr:M48 family metallopeptidase [Candidatus Omnitrophota bacterium]